ncbi:MAG: metallopeptidase family protein [Planctomycetes bacterium]|nr:metallopeptidase family protein [Planctomycetota bacterium]
MNSRLRKRFDELLEQILAELPEDLQELLQEVPVVVDDRPSQEMLEEINAGKNTILCGLHSGIPLTRRSVEHSATLPETIHIFREGIWEVAADKKGEVADRSLARQIRITVLHEMGHHFGLDERELRRLGYG